MSELRLGVAGSNTFRPERQVRLACASDRWNDKTRHIVVKRRADCHGAGGRQTYLTDSDLMARLNDWAAAHGYPNPEGKGTSRAPICLLSNDVSSILQQSRQMWDGPRMLCQCGEWTLKDERAARKEGLPWPCDSLDDERYYIGECTWHNYREEQRSDNGKSWTAKLPAGTEQRDCNPSKCPYATGADPRIKRACYITTDITCQLGEWGGNEPAVIHSDAKATARRFPSSLALVLHEVRAIAGIEIDLVLDWTEPLATPGGGKVRQPFWAVAIPHGLTPSQFRERAIAQARRLVDDNREILRLHAVQQELVAATGTDLHRGALLGEFRPAGLLAEGEPEDATEAGPLSQSEHDAAAELVRRGYAEPAAEAMIRANADDLDALFASLGEPEPEQAPWPDEEPPVLEGEYEEAPEDEPDGLFPVPPECAEDIAARFSVLGEAEAWVVVVGNATKAVLGRARKTLPKPSELESPDQEQRLFGELLRFALAWWAKRAGVPA